MTTPQHPQFQPGFQPGQPYGQLRQYPGQPVQPVQPGQPVPQPGTWAPYPSAPSPRSKVAAALLAWFLGIWGAHSFYLGHQRRGLFQLGLHVLGIVVFIGAYVYVFAVSADSTSPSTPTVGGFLIAILVGFLILFASWVWSVVDMILVLTDKLGDSRGVPLAG